MIKLSMSVSCTSRTRSEVRLIKPRPLALRDVLQSTPKPVLALNAASNDGTHSSQLSTALTLYKVMTQNAAFTSHLPPPARGGRRRAALRKARRRSKFKNRHGRVISSRDRFSILHGSAINPPSGSFEPLHSAGFVGDLYSSVSNSFHFSPGPLIDSTKATCQRGP